MTKEENQIFARIADLISSNNFSEVVDEVKKLDADTKDRLDRYIANTTLHTESSRYRGRVVEMSIYLELILANVLTQYFANDAKKELLNSMVFDRMDLQRKLNLFKKIIRTQHLELWKTEQTNLKKIDALIGFRNNIAHSVLNSSTEYLERIKSKVNQLTSEGKPATHLDEIEVGYFENQEWIIRPIKWTEIEEYYNGVFEGVNKIEAIGEKIIPNYDSTIKN